MFKRNRKHPEVSERDEPKSILRIRASEIRGTNKGPGRLSSGSKSCPNAGYRSVRAVETEASEREKTKASEYRKAEAFEIERQNKPKRDIEKPIQKKNRAFLLGGEDIFKRKRSDSSGRIIA